MPAKEYVDLTIRRRYADWIRQLVEARAPGVFAKAAGKQRFVAAVVQELLDKVLLEVTLALPDDVVARILREVHVEDPRATTLLEYDGTPVSIVAMDGDEDQEGGA